MVEIQKHNFVNELKIHSFQFIQFKSYEFSVAFGSYIFCQPMDIRSTTTYVWSFTKFFLKIKKAPDTWGDWEAIRDHMTKIESISHPPLF